MFWEFHQLEPTKIYYGTAPAGWKNNPPAPAINLKIPKTLKCAGEALWVGYASTKWTGKRVNYIHDHEGGVNCYRPDSGEYKEEVPYAATKAKTVVRLGECLGFGYDDNGKEVIGKVKKPYPELYCTPDGSVLLVIENKSKIIAMMWGGNLNVTSRGIVG